MSAIGGATVICDLEREGGISVAIGVGCWREDEIGDISDSNDLAVNDRHSVEFKGASAGDGGDGDGLEGIGIGFVEWISEAEVGGLEGVCVVFEEGDGVVVTSGFFIHIRDVEGDVSGGAPVVAIGCGLNGVYELVFWGFEIVGLIIQCQAGGGESDFTVGVDLEEAVGGGVRGCGLELEVGR